MTNTPYPSHNPVHGGYTPDRADGPQLSAAAPMAPPLNVAGRPAPIVSTRSNGRVYALAWIAAGLLSAGYVATIIRQPDAVGSIVMRQDAPTTNLGRIAQSVTKTEAELQTLKQAVIALQGGLIDVKSRADAIDARERQLVERIGVVETRVEQFAVASVAAPAAEPAKKAATVAPPPKAPVTKAAVAPKVINQPAAGAPKSIETASIPVPAAKAPAEPAANAAAALADAPKGVVVASGPSVDALRLSWSLLSDRHKATFGKMEPRVVTTDGSTYQLVAGPLPTEAEAAKVCTGLKARGIACRPSEFRGDALQ